MQNLEWAFQGGTFLAAFLFAVVGLAAISLHSHYAAGSSGQGSGHRWLIVAIASAFLAECSVAGGVLTWIVLPFCAFLAGVRRRTVILLSGVSIVGIGVYLIGYRRPGNFSDPFESIGHLGQVFAFVIAYFGESWHFVFARIGSAVTMVALLAIALFAVWRLRRPQRFEPVQAFALSLALMMLLTAFITALGRQLNGVGQAREGRYQTPAMLFWWAVAVLILTSLVRAKGHYRTRALVAFQVACLACFTAEARRFPNLLEDHLETRSIRNTAGLAIAAGVYDEDQIRSIYPLPSAVPPTYEFMLNAGLMTPPFPEIQDIGKNLGSLFLVQPEGTCAGSTELIDRIALHHDGTQDLEAAGWAYYPARREDLERVLAATSDGKIVGVGVSGVYRPDIAASHPEV